MDDVDHATARDEQVADLVAARAVKRAARRPVSDFCEGCSEEISAARRRAVPDARLCVDCQAELEAL